MKTNLPREVSYKAIKIYKELKHIQVIGCFRDKGSVNMCQMGYAEVEV
jgi:hypothetical protein